MPRLAEVGHLGFTFANTKHWLVTFVINSAFILLDLPVIDLCLVHVLDDCLVYELLIVFLPTTYGSMNWSLIIWPWFLQADFVPLLWFYYKVSVYAFCLRTQTLHSDYSVKVQYQVQFPYQTGSLVICVHISFLLKNVISWSAENTWNHKKKKKIPLILFLLKYITFSKHFYTVKWTLVLLLLLIFSYIIMFINSFIY